MKFNKLLFVYFKQKFKKYNVFFVFNLDKKYIVLIKYIKTIYLIVLKKNN